MQANEWPLGLYESQAVKALDQICTSKNVSAYDLMNLAGSAALNVLLSYWPKVSSIGVFCGSGNNGGDGFVLARLAKAKNLHVSVFEVQYHQGKLSPEAEKARNDWLAAGGEILPYHRQALTHDVLVDAIVGIGARFPLSLTMEEAVVGINQSERPVLAIDIPSGLNPDTGSFTTAIKATVTITFIAMKIGLVSAKAAEMVGHLHFDDLGINPRLYPTIKPKALRLDYELQKIALKPRLLAAHKGDYGHVLIIGAGQSGYSGAVCLAGSAALRAGAGLVSAVVAPESMPLLARAPAELMSYSFSSANEDFFVLLERASTLVLGPGLSQRSWGKEFFQAALTSEHPLLIDADGLNWLAQFPQKRSSWILTPHPGEAARLLKLSTQQVQQDRIKAALALHEQYGGVIVLKGAGTVVINEQREIMIHPGAFPVLATGGTGDVLAGLIGGLLAQKISLSQAAQIGVCVHGMAAKIEQSISGSRGMLASDLLLRIRSLLNPCQPPSSERV